MYGEICGDLYMYLRMCDGHENSEISSLAKVSHFTVAGQGQGQGQVAFTPSYLMS